ncbi:MAG: hypothetical protein JNL39_08605 [Opitutaceae bacterium]|nr:hypothetical protein [Opitutaceae bacterium]
MSALTTLFRPVGQKEFDLIARSHFREFPPRLPWQPIFYPVLSLDYAAEIARDWNTKDPENGNVGYVTAFDVDAACAARFPAQRVGGSAHLELWVPAEQLADLNKNIAGMIRVVTAFRTVADGTVEEFTPPGPR